MKKKELIKKLEEKKFKYFFLFIIGLIIFYRSPYILLNGRFVAEEGSFWFSNSHSYGVWYGITQILWHSSYFNFWPNIASVFASKIPIEYAPYVTVFFALIVKIYLFFFIFFSHSFFFESNVDRILVSFIVLVSPPMVPEIWLNTLNSQVYFGILSTLILFQNCDKKDIFYYTTPFVLFISGMSSILCCALTPIFFYNFLKKKNKFNFLNFFLITLSSFFQIFIFVYSHIMNLAAVGKYERFIISFGKLQNFIYNVILKSFFGRDLVQFFYFNFFKDKIIFITLLIILSFLFFIIIVKNIKLDKITSKIIIALFVILLLSYFGSKSHQVQGRYAALPGILLLLSVYRFTKIYNGFYKFIFLFFIISSIVTGFYQFKEKAKYPEFLICKTDRWTCPDWRDEVKKWKKDGNYRMKIWNYPGKSMYLKKQIFLKTTKLNDFF